MNSPPTIVDVARGAITALAPQRLVLALLLVFVVGAVGKLVDSAHLRFGGAAIGPSGLRAGEWPAEQRQSALRTVARTTAGFLAGTPLASEATSEKSPAELVTIAGAAYLEKRAAIEGREPRDDRALASLESRYHDVRIAIEAARPRGPFEAVAAEEAGAIRQLVAATLTFNPALALAAIVDAVARIPTAAVAIAPWTMVLAGLPILAITAILGGGLCRMAVLDAAQGAKLSPLEAAAFCRRRAVRLALVPIFPSAAIAVLVGAIVLMGGLLRVPVLDLLGGFLYGASLLIGFLVVTGGIAAGIGLPLSIAGVAAGDSDAIDANVRSTAYLLRAPGRWLAAMASGVVALSVGTIVVAGVALLVFALVAWATSVLGGTTAEIAAGAGGITGPAEPVPPLAGLTARVAGTFIDVWDGILLGLVAAYVASAVADIAARAYLLLRAECDGQDPSTVDASPLGRPGPG